MNYEEVIIELAPCGLNCRKCIFYANGEIKDTTGKLKGLLDGFGSYAKRFAGMMPLFKEYAVFEKFLDFFSQGDCNGCRTGSCKNPACGVKDCYKEKDVDFCFQCDEFPCEKHNFPPFLKEKWLKINKRIQDIGVEIYYEETKDQPRYK